MGVLNRRRSKRHRIKYIEALRALKAYQNSELRLLKVIDNVLAPNKSLSDRCQVPHCNQPIRWEYVMENKKTFEQLVAGSTCVWELLNLSKKDIKEFERIELAIKDFHKMIFWKKDNMDVFKKIMELKNRKVMSFAPFWEELEYAPLDDEDTQYIRRLDVDEAEKKYHEALKKTAQRAAQQRGGHKPPSDYDKVLKALDYLISQDPRNKFFDSLKKQSEKRVLSPKQISCIKRSMNRDYFLKKIKPNPNLMKAYAECDKEVYTWAREALNKGDLTTIRDWKTSSDWGLKMVIQDGKEKIKQLIGNNIYWKMYCLKHELFV